MVVAPIKIFVKGTIADFVIFYSLRVFLSEFTVLYVF